MTFSGVRELNSDVLCFDKFLRKQWQCLKLFFPSEVYWVFASSRYDICEKRLGDAHGQLQLAPQCSALQDTDHLIIRS